MPLIEDIRKKPHDYKIKLIWTIVICAVVVLLLFWVLVNRMGENVHKASDFFQKQSTDIKQNGQKLYEENK